MNTWESHPASASAYSTELEVAARLAREAGALVMRFRAGGDLQVELKTGDEPVTIADKRSSELVVSGLRSAFPDDIIVSEESADDLRRLSAERVWYIDPIDGTKDFIKGLEGFSVMIGLTVNHRPVIGAVYQPTNQRMFLAAVDCGAWFDIPGEAPRKLEVSAVSDIAELRLVASNSHRDETIDRVKSALGISTEFNIGSVGLKIGLISLGERDLYVNPSPRCKTWDTCAPEAIIVAAGGSMTDKHGEPLRYDLEDTWRRSGIVASNGHLHAAVIERLAALFPRSA